MVKPEWGVKRICNSCSAPFYDLRKDPIVCPKCGATYDPEAILKSRRTRAPVVEEKAAAPSPAILDEEAETEAPETEEAEEVEEEEGAAAAEGGDAEEEEEDTIEDASELGEDEDDMAEVIENIEEDDER